MRHIRKYNEAIRPSFAIESYKSEHVSSVRLLRTTQENGFEIYDIEVTDVDGTKNKLVIDTSYLRGPNRKIRVYYPVTGSYFMDIDNLTDWRQIFEKIEEQANNRLLHKKRMVEVSKMFESVTKDVVSDYFSDLIDISISNLIRSIEDFDNPLYWELYLELKYNISDGGNMLLDDISREILDMIIVDTKRIESDFNVRTSVRISTMPTIKNPFIKICIFAKDTNGDAIGYKIS